MKRKRSTARKRAALDLGRAGQGRYRRPILSQPIDSRAPAPDDARLVAELAWIVALRDGYIPRDRPSPGLGGPAS